MILNIYPMNLRSSADAQIEEMKKHRWIESEKAGRDLGEAAYLDWIKNHAKAFREWWNSRE